MCKGGSFVKQLLTPIKIGSLELKNRIVMAPTSMGLPWEEKREYLGRIADGGAALIYLGDMGVEPPIFSVDCSLFTPEGREHLASIVDRIHRGGAKVGAQLYLWDYDMAQLCRMIRQGCSRSERESFKKDHVDEYVTQMPLERIQEILDHFEQAASVVETLGFDMIQVLGGHILNSFSSGHLNHREDAYGGDTKRRAQFASQVVRAVGRGAPDLPIEYKLSVHDDSIPCGDGAPDISEMEIFVPELEAAGVDAFQAAFSNRQNIMDTVPAKNHPTFRGEGCFLFVSDQVKRFTRLPVSCAGKFSDPQLVEELICSGRLDYVGMSRQLVADPCWVNKVAQGREEDIRKCLFCNAGCLGSLLSHKPFYCVLDGRQTEG